jgi:hypothetical protein
VRDAERVVINHGTGLVHNELSPLLVVRGNGEPDVLIALAGAVGRGRLIAAGDGSIGINAMMRYPGNRAFVRALLRYLVDDDVWGKRNGNLYVLANDFESTGSYGDASRTAGALGDARRALLDGLQTLRHDGLPSAVQYGAAFVLGLGVLAWTSTRVGRTHRATIPRFARRLPAILQGGIAGHAAVLGSPEASRVLAILELKSALEERLVSALGLERTPPAEELVAKVRAARIFDDERTGDFAQLLGELGRIEAQFARLTRTPAPAPRVRDAQVMAVAARMRGLLGAMRPPNAHDRVESAP